MTIASLTKTRPHTAFVDDRAHSNSSWAKELGHGKGPIYAISRKAPRLLELLVREGIARRDLLQRVTSERGLLVDLHSLRAAEEPTLCDDCVIVGSTFLRVSQVVSEAYNGRSVRGLPYAVNRDADPGNLTAVAEFTTQLASDNCCSFVNAETSAFGFLDKPYDIEHPILYLDLNKDFTETAIARCLSELADVSQVKAYPTPRRVAVRDREIDKRHAWTVLFPACGDGPTACFLRKIRIYFDRELHRVLLVPISPPIGTIDELKKEASEMPEELADACKYVLDRIDPRSDASNEFERVRNRTVVSWIAFLLELEDLTNELFTVRDAFAGDGIVSPSAKFTLDSFDLQLLIGATSTPLIKRRIEEYLQRKPSPRDSRRRRTNNYDLVPLIPNAYQASYEKALSELLDSSHSAFEVLEAAFKAQHVGIEIPSRGDAPTNADRLEFGVPLQYIWQLAESKRSGFDTTELHVALDALIDRGVIVPRFLSQKVGGSVVWFRSFRVGERQAEILAHATRECVQSLASAMGLEQLGETLTEKFLVLAAEYQGIFSDPSLASEQGFSRGFHLYGARPRVELDDNSEWLIDWAQRRRVLSRVSGRREYAYRLDERAAPYFREHERSLSPTTRRDIKLLAHWTKTAYETKGLGTDFLITLTTVESPWAYKEALDAELNGWVHHPSMGYTAAIHALDDLSQNRKTAKDTDRVLSDLANWHAQAQKKYLLRSKLNHYLEAADEKWPSDSNDPTALTWVHILRPAFDERSQRKPKPVDVVDTTLLPTLRVVGRISSLLRSILSAFTGLHAEKSRSVSEATEQLISSITGLPVSLRDRFTKAIPLIEPISNASDLGSAVALLREPMEIMAGSVESIRRRFPDLSDEPLDTLEPSLFILFWDMRASTENKTREDVTRRMVEVNRAIRSSYANRLVEFDQDSTDDGNAVVCHGFDTAMQIAKDIVSGLSPDYCAKMGCETNARGNLHRGRTSLRLSGRAFEYTARLMGFFSEVKRDSDNWRCDLAGDGLIPTEPNSDLSYLLISEEAHRLAEESGFSTELASFERLPGRYKARVYGSIGQDVYLRQFAGVAPNEPELGTLPF